MNLYNTLSGKIEQFSSFHKNLVNIYVCGITPYDTTHLGHAFTYLSFDVLIRYLGHKGYEINYTQNVTDINDRDNDILKRAKEQNVKWQDLASYWTQKFLNDMEKLNWVLPNNYLYASENILSMIQIINLLLTKGIAYKGQKGIYVDISKYNNFGNLSRLNRDEMLKISKNFEEDIDNDEKNNPLDITIWKFSYPDNSGHIPSFSSPFGNGRPGWHLECSAMAISSLGSQIDIHGGGRDLIFPHHEAEIVQSEGTTGKIPFSKFWIHTGQVFYKKEKMSKSLGNLIMVSELLKKYSPDVIRYLLLSNHYTKDWEYFEKDIEQAELNIEKIKKNLALPNNKKLNFEKYFNDNLNVPHLLDELTKSSYSNSSEILNILGFNNL